MLNPTHTCDQCKKWRTPCVIFDLFYRNGGEIVRKECERRMGTTLTMMVTLLGCGEWEYLPPSPLPSSTPPPPSYSGYEGDGVHTPIKCGKRDGNGGKEMLVEKLLEGLSVEMLDKLLKGG